MLIRFHIVVVSIILICFSCNKKRTRFELIDPKVSSINFSNTIYETDSIHYFNFPYIYTGGGVGIGDFNNDGLQDIFFSGNMVSSRLYLNKGNFQFEDITAEAGVETQNWATGISIVDINQDGWMDIYLCIGGFGNAEKRKNRLFINNGHPQEDNNNFLPSFTESAEKYGIADTAHSTQAAFFDYDLDGDLDLYIMTHANEDYAAISKLYTHRDGRGLSTDKLYQNIGTDSLEHPFYQNVSTEAGILTEGYGLGLSISDLNKDGWPDIYIANDFIASDLMYINNKDGTFSDKLSTYVQHTSQNGMGVDIADINNDELPDIMVMDMLPESNHRQKTMTANMNFNYFKRTVKAGFSPQFIRNTLQLHRGIRSNGEPAFSEVGRLTGVHQTDWSWAPLFADFNNDGWLDLFITNGFRRDVTDHDFQEYHTQTLMMEKGTGELSIPKVLEQLFQLDSVCLPNYIFQNTGELTFDDQTQTWGLDQPSMSNGSAYADFDNDGDLDLVVNNINAPAFLYRNQSREREKQYFLKIVLEASEPNRNALGAKVIAHLANGQKLYAENYPIRGYMSSVERGIHWGLGKDSLVKQLEIIWPDGYTESYHNLSADVTYQFIYGQGTPKENKPTKTVDFLFEEATDELNLHHQHLENEHSDFNLEPLIPHLYDYHGPGIAVGDINSDGSEDFYIGGARNQTGRFFIQESNGEFRSMPLKDSEMYEDMGALLLDADQDNDLDLYVVSGGSSVKYFQKGHYQDRLYMNDGKGNFIWAPNALPDMPSSGSCIVAADFDHDNDLDLFVGGRIVPGKFPQFPRSYLLENQHGKFQDATIQLAPDLAEIGLITSALWTDYDNDRDLDLMVVGEWMPVTLFENEEGKLTRSSLDIHVNYSSAPKSTNSQIHQSTNQPLHHAATHGFWNSLIGADMDADGDMDYILGNQGNNTAFKAQKDQPLRVFAKDFDNNGSVDAIMTRFIQGREYPIAPRGVMGKQMESIKRLFLNYQTYSEADIYQVLSAYDTTGMQHLEANYLPSSYMENLGDGRFVMTPLPSEAQFAPLFGLNIRDIDADGHLDILGIGNYYSTEVISGWNDASKGIFLRGMDNGQFIATSPAETGFWIAGDTRALTNMHTRNGDMLFLASASNDSLKVMRGKTPSNSQRISLLPEEVYAELHLKNGRIRKYECYRGQGYLSQTSCTLEVDEQVEKVIIYRLDGQSRKLNFK